MSARPGRAAATSRTVEYRRLPGRRPRTWRRPQGDERGVALPCVPCRRQTTPISPALTCPTRSCRSSANCSTRRGNAPRPPGCTGGHEPEATPYVWVAWAGPDGLRRCQPTPSPCVPADCGQHFSPAAAAVGVTGPAVLPAGVIARALRSTYRCQTGHAGTREHLIIRWSGRRRWICNDNDVERTENCLNLQDSALGLPLPKLLDRVRNLFLGYGPS